MLRRLVDRLLGCSHEHLTWPQTVGEATTRSCLDCGRSFTYSWREMETGAEIETVIPVDVDRIKPPRSYPVSR
jgi:hypothetical protein